MNDEPTFDPRRKSAIRELVVTTARASTSASTSTSRQARGKRVAVIAALVVLAVSLSGGVAYALGTGLFAPNPVVSAAPTTSETPTPASATPSPIFTPTSTSSTPIVDAADPSTWIIGFDGVGPVKLGSTLEKQRRTLPAFTDITDPLCVGGYLELQALTGFGLLFVSGVDQPTSTAAITFATGGTRVTDNRSTTPKTTAGIGIDSTKEELLAAYPGIEKTGTYQSDDYPFYGLTDGKGGWIVFGLLDDKVIRIQVANEAVMPIENGSVKTMPSERCPA
ncbi:hypothetical protein [Subtercola frigoramans]|uniref:Uncharacterized protein n=1 Tax=Subtercola frigoramans TaxID=120298 RepID=A0ABS2L3I2_9MICO|nr:hypothetical protein [Subtercola frigoramans]MBM7471628.1 hypothetical protein [Subtercola frigoramans]